MKTASLNDTSLSYSINGKGNPLLFIHGAAASCNHANYLKDYLHGCQLISYSQRFHLPNDPVASGKYGVDQHSDDLLALMDYLGIESLSAFGHSYGGSVLLNAAIKAPSRFNNLFLAEVSIPFVIKEEDGYGDIIRERNITFENIRKSFQSGNSAHTVRLLMNYAIGGFGFNSLPEEIQRDMIANTASLYQMVFNQDNTTVLNAASLSVLNIPVHLLIGRNCIPMYRAVAAELMKQLPQAELFVIPSVAHDLIYNAAEDCLKIVLSKM